MVSVETQLQLCYVGRPRAKPESCSCTRIHQSSWSAAKVDGV